MLDEGIYQCPERTMYRVLAAEAEVRERRAQRRHPVYAAPELWATTPHQLPSWDITKLKGPTTWSRYHLYVMLDVCSRYVFGWMLTTRESAILAERFIATCGDRQRIARGQLTVHADRGMAMTSKPVALLLADLGVTKTHSRPHVSNDNPYSEAQFKTLKYRPDFPDRFGSLGDARAHCADFFSWYNTVRLGSITKAGNTHCRHVLIQAAWSYRHRPQTSVDLKRRQQGQAPAVITHAMKAQQRLHQRYHALLQKKRPQIAVVAVARELVGFLWAVARNIEVPVNA